MRLLTISHLEVGGDEGPEAPPVGEAAVVGEHRARVQQHAVHQLQRPQVVLQPMAHQHRVRVHEPHQVVLHLLQVLGWAALWWW